MTLKTKRTGVTAPAPTSVVDFIPEHSRTKPTAQEWIEPGTFAKIIRIARDAATALEPSENQLIADIAATPAWLRLPRWKILMLESINSKLRALAEGGQ